MKEEQKKKDDLTRKEQTLAKMMKQGDEPDSKPVSGLQSLVSQQESALDPKTLEIFGIEG